jgi:GntR family transcriptional regulator / MocR family aminotransferase
MFKIQASARVPDRPGAIISRREFGSRATLSENGGTALRAPRTPDVDPLFELALVRPPAGTRQASRSLYAQLRAAILDGRLRAGTRLPATRRSATYFGVSRNTAIGTYQRMLSEGYLVARPGSGTYVAGRIPAVSSPRPAKRRQSGRFDPRINEFWRSPDLASALGFWRESAEEVHPSAVADIDFRPALVDARLFPYEDLRRVLTRQLRDLEKRPRTHRSPQGNQGNARLRDAIARHVALTRAVACGPEEVLVTSGAQQAFDLVARVLVKPGRTIVAVEDPGYPPMRVPFAAAGAKLVPVPVDDAGMIVDCIPRGAGIICVCPSHQFPLGATLSVPRRNALIDFARRHGAVIVEDDYDGEFRYEGGALQSLRGSGAGDVVFYVGTFSKSVLPALRLGFLIAPEWALRALVLAKNSVDWHCPIPMQLALAAFMTDGSLHRHIRRMRRAYGTRRARLLAALRADFGEWLSVVPSVYGMHVAALAKADLDLERVTERLLAQQVRIHTLSRYYLGPQTRAGLVFGFGAADVAAIDRGLSALRRELLSCGRKPRAAPASPG